MKTLLITLSLLSILNSVLGQQIPANSLYHNIISFYNPAFTATEYKIRGGLQYRNQWVGIDGAPVTYFGQYEQDWKTINSGFGVAFIHEEIGFSTLQSILLNYRYELKLSKLNSLSLGISAGTNKVAMDPIWLVFDPTDPELPGKESQTKLNLNAGTLLTLNHFKLGISALQVNRPHFNQLNFRSNIHYSLTLDYKWLITRKFNLEPSLFFLTDWIYISTTEQIRANYDEKYWAMIGYRSRDSILMGIGTVIKKMFGVGYNLDIFKSKLNNSSSVFSHGVYLNFQLIREKNTPMQIIGTPEF